MISVFVLSVLMAAQAGPPSAQGPMKQNRAPVQAEATPAPKPSSPEVDRLFAIAATQGGNAEMDMAELALKRASANEVKGYAGKMMAEHKGLREEMILAAEHIDQPACGTARASRSACHASLRIFEAG